MHVAVTGGSGYLGTLVLRRLAADRRIKAVTSFDLCPPTVASGKVRHVELDVRDPSIQKHLAGCDALIHLAFVVLGSPGPEIFHDINVNGSRNVFEAALAANVGSIVYSSSIAAYGVVPDHQLPLVESSPRKRQDGFPYAAAKFDVEAMLDRMEPSLANVPVARLRPSILIGPQMDGSMGGLLRKRLLVWPGEAPPPLVWDEDVADAVMLALLARARGAFNLSAEELLVAGELARRAGLFRVPVPRGVLRAAGGIGLWLGRHGVGRAIDPSWFEVGDAPMIVSSERAKRELGWKPRCPTAVSVIERFLRVAPVRTDPRIALLFRSIDVLQGPAARRLRSVLGGREAAAELDRVHARIHLALLGPSGGDFAMTVEPGRFSVRPGVPRLPDAAVTLDASLFIDLLSGRRDFAGSELTGMIRCEGSPIGSSILAALVSRARESAALRAVVRWRGPSGRSAVPVSDRSREP
jgi:UDP-glucose 4-epimerase